MIKLLLWSVPLLIIPASYIMYRSMPFRRPRYYLYAIVLAIAFFLNLFHVSFINDLVDKTEYFLVYFIVAEFFWFSLRIKKKKVFLVVLFCALGVYGFQHWRWIAAGPVNGLKLWKPDVASIYRRGEVGYRIKDQDLFDRIHPVRVLTLCKQLGRLPFEKQVGFFRTPDGYAQAQFFYKWSDTNQGVRLDIGITITSSGPWEKGFRSYG